MKIAPYQIDSYIETIAKNNNLWGAVVYGPEVGLVTLRANKIAKSIVSDLTDSFLVSNISKAQFAGDTALLADEFFAIPMLGGRKLIMLSEVGNDVTAGLKLIFDNGKKPLGENFVLITAVDLDKNSSLRKFAESNPYIASIACYEDDVATTSQIIRKKFKDLQLTFDDGVVEYIAGKFAKNRLIILNEIDKLALFIGDKKHITIEDIQNSIADISEISITELINNFAGLDPKNADYFLNKLYDEKNSAIGLIRMISGYFLKLRDVKNNLENGANLDAQIKAQKIFFKQEGQFKKHLQHWSLKALNEILFKLQELEVSCKSSGSNPELLLASFVNLACLKYSKV